MQALKKFYFGKQKAKVNLRIGNVSSTINTESVLADILGIPVGNIKLFNIIGSDIECAIISPYNIRENALQGSPLTYIRDDGMMKLLTRYSFSNCPNLIEATLKGVLSTTGEVARDCRSMTWNLPECTSLGDDFLGNPSGNITITVNAPKCSALGSTLGDNSIFCKWWGNVKWILTLKSSLQTVNGGSPDGDIVGLNSGSTITYV